MLNLLKSKLKDTDRTAQVVDGKLILSFPRAKTPILWQMDLGNIKISALEIQPVEEEYVLVLKNPKGETVTIATFIEQDHAVEHLIAISGALGKAQGHIQSVANENNVAQASSAKPVSWFKRILMTLAVLIVLFLGLGIIANLAVPVESDPSLAQGSVQDGQPMSADDFLRGY